MTNYRRVIAEINLDNAKYNIENIVKAAAGSKVMAVVKADAYGHGAFEVAEVCLNNGADCLAVAEADEGISLRKKGITAPILILGYTPYGGIDDVINYGITQTVYSEEMGREVGERAAALKKTCKVHIKIDTGMGRIGFLPNEKSIEEIVKISKMPYVDTRGIFTHFATADEEDKGFTKAQAARFKYMCDSLESRGLKLIKHCANSAAILDMMPELKFDMVRAGIILYGYYPSREVGRNVDIKPFMSVKSHISHVKSIKKGTSVSYGRTFTAPEDMTVATVPVGYADGYRRSFSNKARVIVNGEYAPVIGRVCMDQFMIDVSGIKGIKQGDEVIIIGRSGSKKTDCDELAQIADTISYEILCGISKRVPRVYTMGGKEIKTVSYVM